MYPNKVLSTLIRSYYFKHDAFLSKKTACQSNRIGLYFWRITYSRWEGIYISMREINFFCLWQPLPLLLLATRAVRLLLPQLRGLTRAVRLSLSQLRGLIQTVRLSLPQLRGLIRAVRLSLPQLQGIVYQILMQSFKNSGP